MDKASRRRRWMAAALISALAHVIVLWAMMQTKEAPPRERLQVVELTLEPFIQMDRSKLRKPPPPRAAKPMRLHQPAAIAPVVPQVAPFVAAPSPAGAPPAASGPVTLPAPPPGRLVLDCVERGPNQPRTPFGREPCQAQIFKPPKSGEVAGSPPVNAEWAAAAAAKARKREGLRPEQPGRNTCAASNLGLGCTDDMLIPLVKQKF